MTSVPVYSTIEQLYSLPHLIQPQKEHYAALKAKFEELFHPNVIKRKAKGKKKKLTGNQI